MSTSAPKIIRGLRGRGHTTVDLVTTVLAGTVSVVAAAQANYVNAVLFAAVTAAMAVITVDTLRSPRS